MRGRIEDMEGGIKRMTKGERNMISLMLNKETQISDCEHTLGLFSERFFEIDETTCYKDNLGQ